MTCERTYLKGPLTLLLRLRLMGPGILVGLFGALEGFANATSEVDADVLDELSSF